MLNFPDEGIDIALDQNRKEYFFAHIDLLKTRFEIKICDFGLSK